MSETKPTSQVFYARNIGESTRSGIGQQVYPTYVTEEEWQKKGGVVQDKPYDAHAVGIVERAGGGVSRDYWMVHVQPQPDVAAFEVDKAEGGAYLPEVRYEQLARDIEQRLGRTGLIILVS